MYTTHKETAMNTDVKHPERPAGVSGFVDPNKKPGPDLTRLSKKGFVDHAVKNGLRYWRVITHPDLDEAADFLVNGGDMPLVHAHAPADPCYRTSDGFKRLHGGSQHSWIVLKGGNVEVYRHKLGFFLVTTVNQVNGVGLRATIAYV